MGQGAAQADDRGVRGGERVLLYGRDVLRETGKTAG